MNKKICLHIVSLTFFSRIYGYLTRIRQPRFLVRFIIRRFVSHYQIDLGQYRGHIEDYRSLSDFFVRALDPKTRPLQADPSHILSPCDGIVADLQLIDGNQAVQAKGISYPVSQLLGRELDWNREWWLCTLYLSPANYHRFHYPWSGYLKEIRQLGTRLYPVNRHGVENISGLFVCNERLVLEFDMNDQPVFATAVGATFVGSIELCALKGTNLKKGSLPLNMNISQMEEMGRFNLGSTIILVLPKSLATPLKEISSPIRTGEALFRLSN